MCVLFLGDDGPGIVVGRPGHVAVVAAEDDSASELVALGMHAQDATDALHPTARSAPKPVDDGEPAPAPIHRAHSRPGNPDESVLCAVK
ncbi:hypothetical protein GCM10011331_21060 [Flavimobilis marinus]|nr:hypothetical protein GCM10011331_21060 [Flavimobilis marinus]